MARRTRNDTKRNGAAGFEPIRVEPAYRKVAAALLERITDRTITAGERLPPEIEPSIWEILVSADR